jgi:hypothetical protein
MEPAKGKINPESVGILLANAVHTTNLVCGLIRKVKFATPDLLTEGRPSIQTTNAKSMPPSSVTSICGHLLGDLYSRSLNSEPASSVNSPFRCLQCIAIQIEVTSINRHWDVYTGGAGGPAFCSGCLILWHVHASVLPPE